MEIVLDAACFDQALTLSGPREARSRKSRGVLHTFFFSDGLSYRVLPPVHAGSIRPPNPDAFNAAIQPPRPAEFVLVAPGRVLSPLSCSDAVFGLRRPSSSYVPQVAEVNIPQSLDAAGGGWP
jgi:hypothetical protein